MRWPLDSEYLTVRVDGNRVLLGKPDRLDLFRIADGSLDPLSSYSTDLHVGDFETLDGFLFQLVSGDDGAAFQIVNMNVYDGGRPELIATVDATVDMIKAGHDLAVLFPNFKHQDIRTSGAVIRLRHGGSGPPLLLLHGNPENHCVRH